MEALSHPTNNGPKIHFYFYWMSLSGDAKDTVAGKLLTVWQEAISWKYGIVRIIWLWEGQTQLAGAEYNSGF